MYRIAIRTVALATAVSLASLGLDAYARAGADGPEPLPRGWIHERAARAYDRKQRARRDSIVHVARAQLGVPYVLGGASPEYGFDCSGLVAWVFAQVELRPPRLAAQQARIGTPVDATRLRPGDLLTFGRSDSVSHVGIYIGDGRFIHASSVAQRVIVSRLDRGRYARVQPYAGARRVIVTATLEHPRRS